MSGSAYCDLAIRTKEVESNMFLDFAKFHGYAGSSSEELLSWYQQVPVSKFGEAAEWKMPASGFLGFVPNFDGDFFPAPFEELRQKAPKIDAIFTVGEYEGLAMSFGNPLFKDVKSNFETIIARYFGPDITEDSLNVQKEIYKAYTNGLDKTDTAGYTKKGTEFLGDALFNIGVLEAAHSCALHGNNTYLASFDYFCKEAKDPIVASYPFKASSHCSEFRYLFGSNMMGPFDPTEEEREVMDIMGDYVTNFAKFGNPNGRNPQSGAVTWEKYSTSQPNRYFKIDVPRGEMKNTFRNGRLEVLKEIYVNSKKYQEVIHEKKL